MKILPEQLRRSVFKVFLCLSFMIAWAPAAVGQVDQWGAWENGVTESWWLSSRDFTKEEAGEAIQRWKRIGVVNAKPEAIWAGDYFSGGETHGTYVRWSPGGGFLIANVDKCQALVMGVIYGRVEVTPSLIRFVPEFSKSSATSHGPAHSGPAGKGAMSFVPVKWRSQLLLIPEEEIENFADYAAGLGEFNAVNEFNVDGSYFFHRFEGEKSVPDETPIVPSQYERFLKEPITATVTGVDGRRLKRNFAYTYTSKTLSYTAAHELASLTFVRVNVGTADGAKKGLFLRVVTPDLGETVRLVEVGSKSSRGVLVRNVDEKGREFYYDDKSDSELAYPRVTKGWKLTTAQRW